MSVPPPDKPALHVKACRDLGLTLFPVVAREKRPRDKDWQTREYTWDEIREHYNADGNLGVRIAPDMVVLDIDPRRDPEGRTAEKILVDLDLEVGGGCFTGPEVRTGSGGLHVYFKGRPPGVRKPWGPALEVKLSGQLVVAPGSVHPNGNRYVWERVGEIPELPAALAALLFQPAPESNSAEITKREISYVVDSLKCLNPENFRDYEEWRNLLFACHSATEGSDEGLEAFIDWSTSDPEYAGAAEDVRAIWQAARGGGRTAASLDHAVREAGHVPLCERVEVEAVPDAIPVDPTPADGNVGRPVRKPRLKAIKTALVESGFTARQDILSHDCTATWPLLGLENTALTANVQSRILVDGLMEKQQICRWNNDVPAGKLDSVIGALMEEVNPRLEWVESLVWDGEERMETWLLDICGLEDTRYHRAVSRYILEAGMARLRDPGTKVDAVPVLCGPQGCGKSTFVDRLGCGWAGHWRMEALDTEGVRICHRSWILEIGEIGASRFEKLEQVKDFLTRTHDEFRVPWDKHPGSKKRAFIFIGTTNSRRYLIDSTGNRRFLHLDVDAVDLDAFTRPYVEQLWAEAYAKHVRQDEVAIPREVFGDAEKAREGAQSEDPWEEKIKEYLAAQPDTAALTAADVYEYTTARGSFVNAHRNEVARLFHILERAGYEQVRPGGKPVWRRRDVLPTWGDVADRLRELGEPVTLTYEALDIPGKRRHPVLVSKLLKERGYRSKRNRNGRWWERTSEEN